MLEVSVDTMLAVVGRQTLEIEQLRSRMQLVLQQNAALLERIKALETAATQQPQASGG